jgi:hypothetical protein
MGLWGFEPDEEQDFVTGESETSFAYDPETEWSWSKLALRVLLTPITLGLDCLTCPVQVVLFASADDDGHCHCHR